MRLLYAVRLTIICNNVAHVGGALEQIIIFISCRNNVDALQIQIIFA